MVDDGGGLVELFGVGQQALEVLERGGVIEADEYVRNTGYKIVDEDMILEDGKYYPMFRCVPCADNRCV